VPILKRVKPMTTNTYTRKIGQNRGKPRLWLEGSILLDHGFHHGCSWEAVRVSPDELRLKAGPLGGRKVAGTVDRPIIDINSGAILEGFGGCWVAIEAVSRGKLRVIKGEKL
jgi:DNA (cytosine-5)-methyltransferase 1